MKKIVDFLQYIYQFILLVYSAFQELIKNMIKFGIFVANAVNYIIEVIEGLPDWIQYFAFFTIFVCVVYQLLHRETGGNN